MGTLPPLSNLVTARRGVAEQTGSAGDPWTDILPVGREQPADTDALPAGLR